MSSQLIKNNMELDTPLKKRLAQLMTDGEKDYPFSFATRVGLNKSTFHNIWTKGSDNIHLSTAKKIADATDVNVDWLHKGIGRPYPHEGRIVNPSDGSEFDNLHEPLATDLRKKVSKQMTVEEKMQERSEMRLGFNPDYIADALDIIDQVVEAADVHISNQTKAELIVQICSAMNSPDGDGVKKAVSTVLKLIKAS